MKAITHPLTLRRFAAAILCILALPLIHFVSRSNYNLFHSFADGASIVIAAATFTIIWNSRHRVQNDYFLFTGIAFLFFAFLDALHLLANKNMGVFPAYGNLGPTFYIASRYLLSVSLLCAPLFIHRRLKAPVVLGAYALVCALVVLSIFYWKVFPVCIVDGVGLTPFKVVSDYIICLILAGSIIFLLRHRESFDPRVLRIIVSSIVLSIATGLTFTLYTDPFGITNMMGHLFQLASFYMVYIAFIETSLTKPHEILFRELKQNEEKLIQNLQKLDEANIELNQEINERKRAEEGLRQNREWLRVTLSSIGDAVVAADTEGRVTFLNPVAEEITGWKLEEAIGTPVRNVFRTINEETRLPGEDIVERVLREGCIVNLANHTALIALDGREIPIEDSAAPIRDSSGNIMGVVLVFHDVAEKRRAQEALRESEERFRLALKNAPVSVAAQDLELRYIWAYNQRTAPPEGVIGKLDSEIFTPEEAAHVTAIKRRVIDENIELREQMWFDRPGRRIFLDVCWEPIHDAEGRVTGVASATVDLTPIKLAEEKLRESEDRLSAILEQLPVAVGVHNRDGELILRNSPMDYYVHRTVPSRDPERKGRWKAFDAQGHSLPPEQWPSARALRGEIVNPGVECRYTDDNTQEVWAIVSAVPFRLAGGETEGAIVVIQDITERKRMEEELRKSRDELENRVQERTTELQVSNKALMEYAAKLQRINDELQDFAFIASHDLQEPLRKIQTFSKLIADKHLDSLTTEGQDHLMRVTRSAKRMSELLRSLLDYSRIATRPQPFEPTGLGRVVEEAVSDLEIAITKSGGKVEVGELPEIEADAPQLRQLFQNLISNSIRYCKECVKPLIRISGTVTSGMCQVFIQDNGIGFEEHYVDRIFKPFQRLHGRSASYEGTGMGLAICRKIVERHGGSITAQSSPGQGSTFVVSLPVKQNSSKGA